MPWTAPYSSTTSAMCWFWRLNSAEERRRGPSSRDDVGRPDDLLDDDVLDAPVVEGAEEVADVEDPDDVVERAAVDRVARVRGVDDGRERLLRRQLDGQRDDLGPRDHHVVRLLVGEVEDLVEHLLLRLLDLLGLRDDQADVLLRVHRHPGRRRLDAEEPRDAVRRSLQDPDERVGDPAQPVERHGEPERQPLGPLERDRLRHELAEDDAQVRQDQEREQERDAARDPVAEEVREERLSERTEEDPEDRDARPARWR